MKSLHLNFYFLLFSILGHDNEQADAALMKNKFRRKRGGLIGQENEIILFDFLFLDSPVYTTIY